MPKRKNLRAVVDDVDKQGGNAVSEREQIAAWMKERLEQIQQEADKRIELLRTVGEHPSPVFGRMVRTHGALGTEKRLVAKILGITVGQLDNHYGDDYDLGEAEMLSTVAANALRIATSTFHPDAAKMATYVLDRRGGENYKPPTKRVKIDKDDEAPPVIDSSKLTQEERKQMRAMLDRIAAGGEGEPIDPREGMDVIE